MLKTVGNPSTRYGDQTIIGGNLVIGTAGNGVDFSADPAAAGMTSELLDDYEEGTWTPTLTASGGGITNQVYATRTGRYTKIGRQVTIQCTIAMTSFTNASGNYTRIQGLPYAPSVSSNGSLVYRNLISGTNGEIIIGIVSTAAEIGLERINSDGVVGVLGVNSGRLQQTAAFDFTATYFV